MSITNVIGIPAVVVLACCLLLYFGISMVFSTEQSLATETSQSIEANVNEIVREELILALDKGAMQRGFVYVNDSSNFENAVKGRIKDYLTATYGSNVIIPGLNTTGAGSVSYMGYFQNSGMVRFELNKGNSGAAGSIGASDIGVNYSSVNGQYSSTGVNADAFPSCTISNVTNAGDLTQMVAPDNSNLRNDFAMINLDNPDDAIVGVYLSLGSDHTDDTGWTGARKAYPIVLHCNVDLRSYIDIIGDEAASTTKNDNRSRTANTAYSLSSHMGTDSTGEYQEAMGSVESASKTYRGSLASGGSAEMQKASSVVFNEHYSTALNSSNTSGNRFNVGMDISSSGGADPTSDGKGITSVESGSSSSYGGTVYNTITGNSGHKW